MGNDNPDDDKACQGLPKGAIARAQHETIGGTILPASFYAADAYDSSPQVTGTNKIDTNTFITRYQLGWTAITNNGQAPAGVVAIAPETANGVYKRQLRWKYPPGTTYVTCTTWHVSQANKVLFLTQDGNVKKMDADKFLSAGPDDPILDPASNAVSNTSIWRVSP